MKLTFIFNIILEQSIKPMNKTVHRLLIICPTLKIRPFLEASMLDYLFLTSSTIASSTAIAVIFTMSCTELSTSKI